MAVSEKEREKVEAFFQLAQEEKRLVPLKVDIIDVLYPYSSWPCVLRIVGDKAIELWACELEQKQDGTFLVMGAVLVGDQDIFGRNHWLPEVIKR